MTILKAKAPPGGAVDSVFGRTGAVTAQSGDYTAAQVTNAAAVNAANTFTAAQLIKLSSTTALQVQDASGNVVAVINTTGRNSSFHSDYSTGGTIADFYTSSFQGLKLRNVNASDLGGSFIGAPAFATFNTGDVMVFATNVLLANGKTFTIFQTTYASGQVSVAGGTAQTGFIIRTGDSAPTYQGSLILRDGNNVEFFRVRPSSTLTSTVQSSVTSIHNTNGTPTAGFGSRILLQLQSSTTSAQDAGGIVALWNVATHASRVADLVAEAYYSGGSSEIWRGRGGASPLIGFLGATPAAQQTGGAQTAGGTYGSTEQDMLQKAYDALRTFGFLS